MNKKILLITIIILVSNHINAQTFSENFIGKDFLKYKGVYLKINDSAIEGFSTCFYNDLKEATSISSYNLIYIDPNYTFQSVKDSLVNRVFLVKDILNQRSGESILGSYYLDKAIFLLEDTATKQKIYFKYNTEIERYFPFLTSKILLNIDELCSEIEHKVDDFTSEVKYNSPIFRDGNMSKMTIYKDISKTKTTYTLILRTYGSTVVVDGTGAIILFTDGSKITKSVEIDVDAGSNGFDYSAFIILTQKDLITLSTKDIKKLRLYIFDQDVRPIEAAKFTNYVKCIMEKK